MMEDVAEKEPSGGSSMIRQEDPNGDHNAVLTNSDVDFGVGDRVYSRDKGLSKVGTVMYIGAVEGYQGTWIGVEWDDGDARHDGSLNGIRYFHASSPKSASFLRPQSLCRGIAFVDALFRRYRADPLSKQEQDEMYVLSTSQKRVPIEFVGVSQIQEKQNHLENLIHVSLAYAGIGEAGPTKHVHDLLSNLQELDLRGNLLSDWQVVAQICQQLPLLKVLDLSNNHMAPLSNCMTFVFSVRTLVLNNCGISWEQVERLKHSFPYIEEFHLDGNKIESIKPLAEEKFEYVRGFSMLRILSLEGNGIKNWNEILKLSQLGSLEELHLGNNKLKNVWYPNCVEDGFKPFQNLRCLLIGGNEIEDLRSVDALNSFPSLTDVRLSNNPVNSAFGGVPRYILVARLAKVTMLNGSEVSQRERKDSEIRYVRQVMNTMKGKVEDISQDHPRFGELKALHDVPEAETGKVKGLQNMASGLVSITLTYVGASAGEKAPMNKKLPVTITVAKLRVLCEGFFKLSPNKQKLFLKEKDSPIPTLLNNDIATLADIGIERSGGEILVDDVDYC